MDLNKDKQGTKMGKGKGWMEDGGNTRKWEEENTRPVGEDASRTRQGHGSDSDLV
jgi:hypothetical protein